MRRLAAALAAAVAAFFTPPFAMALLASIKVIQAWVALPHGDCLFQLWSQTSPS